MNKQLEILRSIIDITDNIVVITGAGISTAAGIKDFRSEESIREIKKYGGNSVEDILSTEFFMSNTEKFYTYYKKMLFNVNAEPTISHIKLAKLEKAGKIKGIITQNTDGLHQKAGSKKVIELHGSIYKNNCIVCGKRFNANYIGKHNIVPKCDKCGAIIKPDITLYGDLMDETKMRKARKLVREAEYLFVLGTSLNVYPAASLLDEFNMTRNSNGKRNIIIMNKGELGKPVDALLYFKGDMNNVWKQVIV